MDDKEIQARIDRVSNMMLAKGLREPSATVHFKSNAQVAVGGSWKDARGGAFGTDKRFEYSHADTVDEAFEQFESYITAMPDAAERRHAEFMGALGNLIDLGKETGIDVEFVNPLVRMMKKLSENAITHEKGEQE